MLNDLKLPLLAVAVAVLVGVPLLVAWWRRRRMHTRSVRSLDPVSGQWLADHRRNR
jgi:hypothetical protein